MSGLLMLKEHVDDTEDLINIELDNRCCACVLCALRCLEWPCRAGPGAQLLLELTLRRSRSRIFWAKPALTPSRPVCIAASRSPPC